MARIEPTKPLGPIPTLPQLSNEAIAIERRLYGLRNRLHAILNRLTSIDDSGPDADDAAAEPSAGLCQDMSRSFSNIDRIARQIEGAIEHLEVSVGIEGKNVTSINAARREGMAERRDAERAVGRALGNVDN
jgi:hypothetical protein